MYADDHPPWPTTPHPPNSPIPNLRRSHPPSPLAKEPQIYGQPTPGLVSPTVERPDPYLRARITGLDRNRRDILVRFDAQTNLPNFSNTTFRNISRSYAEFQQFYDAIVYCNPQTIVPALPLAQTSAPTDEEDDRLIKIMLQRWLSRVCDDPFLQHDEEVRSFIESDFGYQPAPRGRRKTGSSFSLFSKSVPDEDEELLRARFELTKIEGLFFDTAKAIDKLSKCRKSLATAQADMGNKLISVASTENHPPLAVALRKFGRTWHSLSDLGQAQSISDAVILADTFGYEGLNARSAKETLQQRTAVLEEYQAAVKASISKRRHIERLKASSNIRPEKVDEALEDMEEANKYENILARRVDGISQNLRTALQRQKEMVKEDVTTALIEHARSTLMYERQLLRELEALRPDIQNATSKVPVAEAPKPKHILKLDDDYKPPPPPPEPRPPVAPTPRRANDPLIPQPQSPGAGPSQTPIQPEVVVRTPVSHQESTQSTPPMVSEPPLGGRFVDGTKSMFVTTSIAPIQSARTSTPPVSSLRHAADPLQASPGPRSAPLPSLPPQNLRGDGDPLGFGRATNMSQSVRLQPNRPRLDPREAASKLANMF